MKRFVGFLLVLLAVFVSYGCTAYHAQGVNSGMLVGGVAGALLDDKNPWRGGVIGGALGSVFGASMADISLRASQEAARYNRPVEYRAPDNRYIYRAEPGQSYGTSCRKIRERLIVDGHITRDNQREVCEGRMFSPEY